MKKIISILLVLTTVLLLTGCVSNQEKVLTGENSITTNKTENN